MARVPRDAESTKKAAATTDVVVKPKRAAKPKAAGQSKGKTVTVDRPIPAQNTASAVNTITAIRSWGDVANEQPSAGSAFLVPGVGGTAGSAFGASPSEIPPPVRDAVNALVDEVSTSDQFEGRVSFGGNADVRYFWREDQLRDRQELIRELDRLLPDLTNGIAALVSELRRATEAGGRLGNQREEIEAEAKALESIPHEVAAASTSLKEQVESEQPSRATGKTAAFLFGRIKDHLAALEMKHFLIAGTAVSGGLTWLQSVLGQIGQIITQIHHLF